MSDWKIVDGGSTFDFETDLHLKVQQAPGTGMPPVTNVRSEYGLLDGALYQRTRADTRQFSLIGTLKGDTTADLHSRRRALVDRVKMDRSASQQPTVIQYLGSGSTLQASGFYTGGLEFGDVEHNIEANVGLGFEMLDPYWEAPTSVACDLVIREEITDSNYIIKLTTNGQWQAMASGVDARVNDLVVDQNSGLLYVLGRFTTVGSGIGASRVASWDGEWHSLGAGFDNHAIAGDIDSQGRLVVGGAFEQVNGSALKGLARYDSPNWEAIPTGSSGLSTQVNSVLIASDGKLFAGGIISEADGTSASGLAVYDGLAWSEVGSSPLNLSNVYAICENQDVIIVGGTFAGAGIGASRLAQYNTKTDAWSPVGSGVDDSVWTVARKENGEVYAGGQFENAGSFGASGVVKWNDVALTPLGERLEDAASGVVSVFKLLFDANQDMYVSGNGMDKAGGISLPDQYAVWNGSTYKLGSINLPGDTTVRAMAIGTDGTLYLGFDDAGTASAANATLISNPGTSVSYPIIQASGPGRMYDLTNYTTGKSIQFNLTLLEGETVTLDLRTGKKEFSSDFRGNLLSTILPSSSFSTFTLKPGDNYVKLFMSDPSASATIEWTPRYWSLDGNA